MGKSDHSILKFETPFKPPEPRTKIRVCYEKGDYEKLNSFLSNINWEEELNKFPSDVNKQWTFFRDKYLEAEREFIPRKKVFINGKLSKKLSTPYDKKTLQKIKKKCHIWSKKRKQLASEEENMMFNRLRNQVRSLTRKGTRLIEKKIAKNAKSNPKAFFAYAQSKLKTRSGIPDLAKPDTEKDVNYARTDEEKAEVLVDYFSSVFTIEPDLDAMPPFEEREYDEPLYDIDITPDIVLAKLKKLKPNKSPGPDGIHPRVLNNAAPNLSLPLSIIFSTSLSTKTLPAHQAGSL